MTRSRLNSRRLLLKLTRPGYPLFCMLAILVMVVSSAQASVSYSFGSAPVVTASSLINNSYQINTLAEILAENESLIPVNITSSGVVNSTVDANVIYSIALANSSTFSTDIALVTGSAAGSSLTSVNAQENYDITTFAGVSASSVTSALTDAADGSSASLSGNSILAETGLNQSEQAVQGSVDTTFDSSHLGGAVITDSSPLLVGDAGLFAGSTQINRLVAPVSGETDFAEVSGNQIALTANTSSGVDTGSPLSLTADENSIGAAFTGNSAENVVAVETGGATGLTSSAGIANLQVNSAVAAANGDSASLSESSISVSVQTDAANTEDPLTAGSISFDGNSLEASAVGSESVNQLTVAEGLNVDADGGQANSIDFTSGSETLTVEGGLFLGNAQLAIDSAVTARATGPATGPALSVDSRGLINSALSADGNSFEAIALGNDASSTLSVGGATSFTSTVAAQNVQASVDSAVSAVADSGTIEVRVGAGELATHPTTATLSETDTVSGSSISVDDNTVSALAVANRDPLVVSIQGTNVTDGISQVAGASLDYGTRLMASTAGLSAVSGQLASGSSVAASNTGAEIRLSAGDFPTAYTTGPAVNNSTLTQSGNTVSSLANLNEGLVALGVEANAIDASSSVASAQNATVSNVTAVTSGIISTGINARQLDSGSAAVNENLTVLVGDGGLSDDTDTGNSISATAGGNLNETVLDVAATTSMLVTGVIDQNGASSSVLSISAGPLNQAMAEMSVLTDQRLDNNTISATTEYSQIFGVIRRAEFDLADSTLNVDGNRITATARGNLTSNSLDFSALDIDMSAADATGGAAGSNLAATGAVQVIGESSIAAAVKAGGGMEIRGRMFSTGSDLANIALSVDQNEVVATATGNVATSTLSGSGGVLAQDVPADLSGSLTMAPTTGVQVADTAVANAVVQVNAGSVSASLATSGTYEIIGRIDSSANATNDNLDLSVDGNVAIAIATGSSAEADTQLAFTTLESSAATAVQQLQSGDTTATAGGDGDPGGSLGITALIDEVADLTNTVVSASGNTAGAQATGAVASASLTAGGEDTVSLASGSGTGAAGPGIIADLDNGSTQLSADYMLGVQQAVAGETTAMAENMSVLATGGNFADSSLAADGNYLTAQATGGSVAADLALAAGEMTGGTGANTVSAILASEQFLTGRIYTWLTNSDVSATAVNLTTAATGTNGSEAISVDDNTLLASGTGLKSVNTLTTDADTSVAGDGTTEPAMDLTFPANGGVTLGNLDRLLVSFQDVSADVNVTALYNSVNASVSGSDTIEGDIEGDSLTVDGNTLLAQGIGASSSNTLATSAGASIIDFSQGIVAGQDLDAGLVVANNFLTVTLDIAGSSTDAALSVSENQLAATATGLKGANTLSLYAPASISDGIDSLYTHDILSVQLVGRDAVGAICGGSQVGLTVAGGDVLNSSLAVNGNLHEASAQGATNTNTLIAESGAIEDVGFQIGAAQWSEAPVAASGGNSGIGLWVEDGAASGATLELADNTISANAGNLKGVNSLTVDSATANTGDAADTHYETINLSTTDLGGTAESDRTIVSLQAVTDDGDVTATIENSWMKIYVSDELEQESSAALTGNSVAASATVAANTNTLANSAGTLLDASSLIASVQASTADATAVIDDAWLEIYVDYPILNSKADLSDNRISATATGLSATNTLAATGGSIQGTMVDFSRGWIDAEPLDQEMYGFSAIASDQEGSAYNTISARIDAPYIGVDAYDYDSYSFYDSTIKVDNNLVQAVATQAAATNSLTQEAETAMIDAPALVAASQEIYGHSLASISINDGDGWIGAWASEDIQNSAVTVNGNTVLALAKGATVTNTLDVTAGSIEGNIDYGDLVASGYYADNSLYGSSALSSLQRMDGSFAAAVGDMEIGAGSENDDLDYSSVEVDDNQIQAVATAAAATNALTQKADTAMIDAPALLAATQSLDAGVSAGVGGVRIETSIYDDVLDSSISVSGNTIQAAASGGVMTNDLGVTANWIEGTYGPTGYIDSDSDYNSLEGISLLSSAQDISAGLSASVEDTRIDVEIDYYLSDSAVHVDENLIQASSTMAGAANTLNQSADTAMYNVPAVSSASQILEGYSYAEVGNYDYSYSGWVGTQVDDDVTASNLTVDNNAIQAVATGGTMTNALKATAGTYIDGYNTWYSVVDSSANEFSGTYGLASRQESEAYVSALVGGWPQINIQIGDGDADGNSTLSVSGNTIMSRATNLNADNTLVTEAGTQLDDVVSGILSYQVVAGETSAHVYGADVSEGVMYDLVGSAAVDGNLLAAVATGGSVTNTLDVSAMSIDASPTSSDSTLVTSLASLAAQSGEDVHNSLLNVQYRDAAVLAIMDSTDDAYLAVAAGFGSITGSVSVSENLLAAQARGLVAENSLSLTSETLIDGGSTALGSVQYGDAAVTVSIVPGQDEGLIFLGADALTGTAVLDDNTVLASATSNLAVNSLSASAATQIVDLGTETTTTIGVAGTSITAGTVGFTLQNGQYGSVDAPVTASIQNMTIDSAIYTVTGTASVDGNTVMATARGQAAQNSLVLNAGTDLEASASLANAQVNNGGINASIQNGRIALNTDTAGGTVSVSDNTVQASGTANLAINSMDITGTLASSGGGSAAGLTASADYVALNAQTNTAGVASAIGGYTIALNSSTSTTGTASVDDNLVLAEATGNSSSNTFTITTVGGSAAADFAFTGVQMNSGNVSSSISGVSISLSSLGGTGNFSAVGNSVGSVSTGNVSVSSIKSGL